MHDLIHSTTSCHFKICLKSHTIETTARRDLTAAFSDTASYDDYAGDGTRGHCTLVYRSLERHMELVASIGDALHEQYAKNSPFKGYLPKEP